MIWGSMAKARRESGHHQKHRQHSHWLVCSTGAGGIFAKMEGLGMRNEKKTGLTKLML